MTRLKSKLLSLNAAKPAHLKTKVFSPANCEELRIPIRTDKTAKVVGKLAEQLTRPDGGHIDEALVNGAVLVQNDLKLSLMAPEDLREYAGLTTTTITCRQKITLAAAGLDLIRWALEGTFGGVVEMPFNDTKIDPDSTTPESTPPPHEYAYGPQATKLLIMDTVQLTWRPGGEMEVEWEGNMMNDGIADAVLAVLLGVESSPAAVKRTSPPPPIHEQPSH